VFIAAAIDGNADFKIKRAAHVFRANSLITLNLLEASRLNKVGTVTYLSSAEIYPSSSAYLLAESLATTTIGDASLGSYAVAKLFGETASRMFYQEYGLPVAIARPCNVYGPGDTLDRTRGRVIPQWILSGLEGQPITIWGAGTQARSFIYIDDLVDGLLSLSERYACASPVNLAGTTEVTLVELARIVKSLGGFSSPIEFTDAPAGSSRRVLDIALARRVLDFEARVSLLDGLAETLAWVRAREARGQLIAT
jgi:nucleoside-diphosphate-sugar epimerase